jgi:hypothetical protein
MFAAVNLRTLRKFGLWYLAYETVCFVATIAYGAYLTQLI